MNSHLNLIFSIANRPWYARFVGLLIRTGTWSAWSHVEVEVDEAGALIGAQPSSGVGYAYLSERVSTSAKVTRVSIPCSAEQKEKAITFLMQQLGKPYDFVGVIGLGLHRNWQKDDRWFCSELIAAALLAAGIPALLPEYLHRVTPQRLFELPFLEREILKA